MKYASLIISQAFGAVFALSTLAQGTFQNLNFEEAMPNAFSGPISAANAIPDWTAEIGGVQQTEIYQNGFSTGAPEISLLTPNPQQPPIDGEYSVLLESSTAGTSISQTGLIPSGTESLFFDAQKGSGAGGNGNLEVMIGTQSVPLTQVATFPSYTLYGANISAWAGDTEQLTFTAPQATTAFNIWEIDDISFSPGAVPEPSTIVLTGIGGLLFTLYRRFSPKRH